MESNNNNQDSGFDFGSGSACFQPFPPLFSPSPRRLSSHFTAPNKPIKAQKQLSLISLQGRLVGAEEATSARAIGGLVGPQEAVAWDLFSPVQRVLVVAVVAVAAASSKKNKQIFELKKSVELRDLVLAAMQEELDSLCEQVNYFKDQPDTMCKLSSTKNGDFSPAKSFAGDINYGCCGCQPCDYHQYSLNDPMGSAYGKSMDGDLFNYQLPFTNVAEPEERRMSNLSDWAPSVISSLDFQLQLDNEQDIYNLRKECEEKDTTIKELSTVLESSEAISSKRIAELEDIIRRKNTIITKLKKDTMILEQKVMNLSRLRRPSFTSSGSAPSPSPRKLPLLTDNLIYDMDSTTSPSSSDSDCPANKSEATVAESQKIQVQSNILTGDQKPSYAKHCNLVVKSSEAHQRIRPVSPLKEKSLNQKSEPESFPKPKQPLSASGNLKTKRRLPTRTKDGTLSKKWT